MQASFNAVVVGLSDTDSAPYVNGSVCVSFDVFAHAPIGETMRRVSLPLFSKEQARELAALYRGDTVRIIIDSSVGNGDGETTVSHVLRVVRKVLGAQDDEPTQMAAERITRELVDGHTELDRLGVSRGDGHGLVTRFTLTNRITILAQRQLSTPMSHPLVNGRPSCCEACRDAERYVYRFLHTPSVPGWFITNNVNEPVRVCFCPFCGARLPDTQEAGNP